MIALSVCLSAVWPAYPTTSRAEPISGGAGLEGLGSFTGTFSYTPGGPGNATLVVHLDNASPLANGGFLTAFLFNNPSGRVTGAALTPSSPHFTLLGGPSFDGGVDAAPFGDFDLGAGVGDAFLGGGSPRGGIAAGGSDTFTFSLTGAGLDGLTEQSFFTSLSDPSGEGDGRRAFFVARFRGFEDGGSDKGAAIVVQHAPEPATLALASIGIAALGAWAWRGRRNGQSAAR